MRFSSCQNLRVFLVVGLGGLGLAVGWFFSPNAAMFRKLVHLALWVITGLIVLSGGGAVGWGLAWVFSYIPFFAGFGHLVSGVNQKLAETPTTFGSVEWADASYLKGHKLFNPKPERVADANEPATLRFHRRPIGSFHATISRLSRCG